MITTTHVTRCAKNQILGTMIVNNATLLALLAQDQTLFNVSLVTTLIIIFMIEEQSVLKHAEMENF